MMLQSLFVLKCSVLACRVGMNCFAADEEISGEKMMVYSEELL